MEPNHQRLNDAFQAGDADSLLCLIKRSQDRKEKAQQKLKAAAQAGDFDALYDSLHHFPDILDRIDETPFVDTPLHVAAKAGHTRFALEVVRLKPSFGRKLNPDGLSPLHLALENGHPETAQRLVKFDKELIRVKGRDGSTPLHLAAERGETDALAEFLRACPASIEDLTVRDKCVLHIAVEHCRIRALKVLLGWIKRTNKIQVLNWRDDEGNTALHAAVSTSQTKECMLSHLYLLPILFELELAAIAELLIKSGANMNEKNLEGYTALDLALTLGPDCRTKTETILGKAGALKRYLEAKIGQALRARRKLSMEMSHVLLLVAVLIATATFQTVLQPPHGVHYDKKNGNRTVQDSNYNVKPTVPAILTNMVHL
ncbi:Non-specific serine/threonine protein kinase [Bertholletia excelsa]